MKRVRADIHVCLVSRQIMQNLLPILADRPRQVYGIVTPEMEREGEWQRLKHILKELHIKASKFTVSSAEDWPRLLDSAEEFAASLEGACGRTSVAVNMTGGTKLMAMAYVQVLGRLGAVPIYMDTPHDRIQEVLPEGGATQTIGDLLTVQNFLWARHLEITSALSADPDWRRSTQRHREVTERIAETFTAPEDPSLKRLWSRVKAAAQQAVATGRLVQPFATAANTPGDELAEQTSAQAVPGDFQDEQLQHIRELPDVCIVEREGNFDLRFAHRASARYLSGGWVEEYVYLAMKDVQPHDFSVGPQVRWIGPRTRRPPFNELDAVAVHRNRMLLVECKDVSAPTAKSVGGREKKVKIADYLYKLNTLRDLTQGLFGTTLLLSAQPLGEEAEARSAQLQISLLAGRGLLRLREFLKDWIEERRAPSWAEPWR